MAVVVINTAEIRRFATGAEVRRLMSRAGIAAHRSILTETMKRYRKGDYARGLKRPTVDGQCVVTIRNTDRKALWLERGTKPHPITGNPFLYWPGASHPVRSVRHPGTRAYRPMQTGLEKTRFAP